MRCAQLTDLLYKMTQDVKNSSVIFEGMRDAIGDLSVGGPTTSSAEELKAALTDGRFDELIATADLFTPYTASRSTAALLSELVDQIDIVVDICDDVVARFGDNTELAARTQAARALVRKGIMQRHAGKPEAAVATCSEAIARFETSTTLALQESVAKALLTKGLAHEQLYADDPAIATYDEVLKQFSSRSTLEFQCPIAKALLRKGIVQGRLERFAAAQETCDALLARFTGSKEPDLRLASAHALVYKGYVLKKVGDTKAALDSYTEALERFSDENRPELQALVANATVSEAGLQADLLHGNRAEAMATCDAVADRLALNDDTPAIQAQIAHVLVAKAGHQILVGQAGAALSVCNEIDQKCRGGRAGDLDLPRGYCDCSLWITTTGLVIQGRPGDALDSFRALYTAFSPKDVMRTRLFTNLVPVLIAQGARATDLVAILSGDEEKARVLDPLIRRIAPEY